MGSTGDAFDVVSASAKFPALNQKQVYLDNAGGTQVLGTVIDSITDYLKSTNVQLGASYRVAQQTTDRFNAGMEAAATYMNAGIDDIAIGPSTTQLFSNLSQALEFPPNSEIVISSIDHEANISPWVRAAKAHGLTVKWWTPSNGLTLTPENLRPLLSESTRLVACTHTSNVLGTIHDIKAIANEVHKVHGAMLCVDGVAYAPHREVDVKALDVDFYSFSWYKVYGPHIAILYASPTVRTQVQSLGHYFHTPAKSLQTKLGLAASSYELVASIPAILAYLGPDRKRTWEAITLHEQKLQAILLNYLRSRVDVKIHGEKSGSSALRVPVVSFNVEGRSSKEIVEEVEKCSDFGIRWGHFYSKRMVDDLLDLKVDGVVRVSMVHYNTEDQIQRLVKVFQEVLA